MFRIIPETIKYEFLLDWIRAYPVVTHTHYI